MGLTIKQENFCNKYVETGNASEAYRFAYNCEKMSPESTNVAASKLLDNPKITLRVNILQKEIREKSDISKERVLEELKAIMESDIRNYLTFTGKAIRFKNFKDLTDKQAKAIEGIKKVGNNSGRPRLLAGIIF